MKLTYPLLASLLVAGVARAGPETARLVKPAADLPVRDVTVFSDRARVTRSGDVPADRWTPVREGVVVRLPMLPLSVDPASVRLEATGARVVRVDVQRAEKGEFPRGEAQELLERIEKLRDEEASLRDAIALVAGERDLVRGIRPIPEQIVDPKAGPTLLEPAGWRIALAFLDAREQRDTDALPSLEQKLRAKQKEIAAAVTRAQQIAMDTTSKPGWTVDAFLDAKGKSAALTLTYMASNARWFPTYDVRFTPGEGAVDVDFSGLVSQQTGEDWDGARLVLSTAIPATTATLPKLSVWKIGDKDRFIPTPVAEWQPPLNPPPRPPPARPIPLDDEGSRDEALRRALAQVARASPPPPPPPPRPAPPPPMPRSAPARPSRSYGELAERKTAVLEESYDVGDEGAYDAEAEEADAAYDEPAPAPEPSSAPPMAPVARAQAADFSGLTVKSDSSRRAAPTQSVGFGAPRAWSPPVYEADLPAALAGGYDFTYPSARPETVRSGGEARRIALHSKRFAAEALVSILPALSKQAYLVTEVKNDGDKPLLKGRANLFVGSDLVGEAVVPTTAVGAKLTLPLGVDEAIRIERNVQVLASERGVFSKQDVNAYEVTIELMNPRARPVKAVVTDQVPLAREKNVEVAFDKAEPAATPDATEGTLEWRLDLPAGVKKTLKFTFTFARPKGARPWQVVAPLGSR